MSPIEGGKGRGRDEACPLPPLRPAWAGPNAQPGTEPFHRPPGMRRCREGGNGRGPRGGGGSALHASLVSPTEVTSAARSVGAESLRDSAVGSKFRSTVQMTRLLNNFTAALKERMVTSSVDLEATPQHPHHAASRASPVASSSYRQASESPHPPTWAAAAHPRGPPGVDASGMQAGSASRPPAAGRAGSEQPTPGSYRGRASLSGGGSGVAVPSSPSSSGVGAEGSEGDGRLPETEQAVAGVVANVLTELTQARPHTLPPAAASLLQRLRVGCADGCCSPDRTGWGAAPSALPTFTVRF